MKIVGISGSPRKAGNTEFLLNEALAVAAEYGFQTERLLCSELNFDFCSDCGDCSKGKPCPNKDDMHKVLRAMQEAEGIIVASPVYFGNVTAQLKA
ncbi:MAG: flavodoxin family protein, partial [Methanosarcinales archaeon]|nr:flavodoxin family protein [Methanosarcinales archaeon]